MKLLTKLAVALALVLGSLVLLAETVTAAPAQPDPTGLAVTTAPRLDPKGHAMAGQYLVVAILKTADGKVVDNQPVTFYEQMQFLGASRDALIGTATTDSTGTAVVAYQPTQAGQHTLVARSAASAQYAQSETKSTLQVSRVVSPFPVFSEPLASLRTGLTIGVVLIVASVWFFLAGLAVRAILGIRAESATLPAE